MVKKLPRKTLSTDSMREGEFAGRELSVGCVPVSMTWEGGLDPIAAYDKENKDLPRTWRIGYWSRGKHD